MITLKVILIGDGGVGKTSLVRSLMQEEFKKDYLLTVGVDVKSKVIKFPLTNVLLSVNDIAGQDRFESFRALFFKGAALALLVFDLTRYQSIKNLENSWIPQLAQVSDPNTAIHCILIGNKLDLEDLRAIASEEAEETLISLKKNFPNLKFVNYIETSALENTNVDNAFLALTKGFLEQTNVKYE
ncbi:MAG: Rab family GTPase [Candidatus Hodarchaeales archaeon]